MRIMPLGTIWSIGPDPYAFVSMGEYRRSGPVEEDLTWLAEQNVRIAVNDFGLLGSGVSAELIAAIRECAVFLFWASEPYFRSSQGHEELRTAVEARKPMIAVQIEMDSCAEFRHGLGEHVWIPRFALSWSAFHGTLSGALARYLDVWPGSAPPPPPLADVSTAGMVMVPGGELRMGSAESTDEEPVHVVQVDDFWIDRHPVTNEEFLRFVDVTGYQTQAEIEGGAAAYSFSIGPISSWHFVRGASFRRPAGPKDTSGELPDLPVVQVTWNDAMAYCRWAGKRLPTEAEWEQAARGGLTGGRFPWGNEDPGGRASFGAGRTGAPVPTGSFKPNGFDLFDMAGNVAEWVADWYAPDYYAHSPARNPCGPRAGTERVVRGGSWYRGPELLRCAARQSLPPHHRFPDVGFRCAATRAWSSSQRTT